LPTSNASSTDALFDALVHYGLASHPSQIDNLKAVYASALETTDPHDRFALWPRLIDLIAQQAINPNPLLAMAICDPEQQIAATCALDFVCFSDTDELGRPRGIGEFVGLFPNAGIIANPGAAFGGLLALGDQGLASFYRETTRFLSDEHLQVASDSCRSGRIFHAVIDYWLWVLEELIEDPAPAAQSIVGIAAAAIVGLLQSADEKQVTLVTRDYPCTKNLRPVGVHQRWSIPEYTEVITPRLRALADREPPPRIMPDVLRAWTIGGH
jgi:hypothetical protein